MLLYAGAYDVTALLESANAMHIDDKIGAEITRLRVRQWSLHPVSLYTYDSVKFCDGDVSHDAAVTVKVRSLLINDLSLLSSIWYRIMPMLLVAGGAKAAATCQEGCQGVQ